jgi:hypothetical protein
MHIGAKGFIMADKPETHVEVGPDRPTFSARFNIFNAKMRTTRRAAC